MTALCHGLLSTPFTKWTTSCDLNGSTLDQRIMCLPCCPTDKEPTPNEIDRLLFYVTPSSFLQNKSFHQKYALAVVVHYTVDYWLLGFAIPGYPTPDFPGIP